MNLAYVFNQGDPVLISVFMLLALMSLASWYIIFWKMWQLRSERRYIREFQRNKPLVENWQHLLPHLQTRGAVALLFKEATQLEPFWAGKEHNTNKETLSVYLAQVLDNVRIGLDHGLTLLASVGSSAPFIGLFGTVWGIYGALTHIAAEGNASLNIVAGPMGEALVATAAGLFAAIPAVLAYNAFSRINRVLVQDLRHIAEQMTLHLFVLPEHTATPLTLVRR